MFTLTSEDNHSFARTGRVRTKHGSFETPLYIPVATQATLKSLGVDDLNNLGAVQRIADPVPDFPHYLYFVYLARKLLFATGCLAQLPNNFTNKTEIKYFVSDQGNDYSKTKPEIIIMEDEPYISYDADFILGLLIIALLISGVIYFVHKNKLSRPH